MVVSARGYTRAVVSVDEEVVRQGAAIDAAAASKKAGERGEAGGLAISTPN